MKSKNLLLITGSVITICFILGTLYLLSLSKRTIAIPNPSFPTPTPVAAPVSQNKPPIKLLSTSPANGEKGVKQDEPIILTFNQPVATDSVTFTLFPSIDYILSSRLNSIIITPQALYDQDVVYQYSLSTQDGQQLVTASFSAGLSPNPIIPLTGRYPNLDSVANAAQREEYPDVYLSNYTPYQTASFSIDSDFSTNPTGHYVFTVTSSAKSGKQDFLSWLTSLGMTKEEIGRLQISYQ